MRYLSQEESEEAMRWILKAAEYAKQATCLRQKCGSVIVKDGELVSWGFNHPVNYDEALRRCLEDKNQLHRKITDKTCCVHAEQDAIFRALREGKNIVGARMYFTRVDDIGRIVNSGRPYCTACSKVAAENGISEWVLKHEEGFGLYFAKEYHLLSYRFRG